MKTNLTRIQDSDDKWARGDARPPSSPSEHVDHSLIGPIISVRYEPLPHRILPNVIPFFSVALLPSQAPIPFVFLPFPLLAVRPNGKPALPILDPGIERESGVMRRAEEVNVVWHETVGRANETFPEGSMKHYFAKARVKSCMKPTSFALRDGHGPKNNGVSLIKLPS